MSRLGDQEYGMLNGSCFSPYGTASDGVNAVGDKEKMASSDKDSGSDSSRTRSSSPPWVPGSENFVKDNMSVGSVGSDAGSMGEVGGAGKETGASDAGSMLPSVVGGGGRSVSLPAGSLSGGQRSDSRAGNGQRSGSCNSEEDTSIESDKKKKVGGAYAVGGDLDGSAGGDSSIVGKETSSKTKLQEEDDEATDSADEGEGEEDTPNSMIMDFNPPSIPQSNHSSASEGGGPSGGRAPGSFTMGTTGSRNNSSSSITNNGGVAGAGSRVSHRTTVVGQISSNGSNHYEENGGVENSPSAPSRDKSSPGAGGSRSGTVAVESMSSTVELSVVEPSSSAVSMIVGYGVPAASQHNAENKSLPGTPTLDDSPLPVEEEKVLGTPLATPMATTPVLSPAISLLQQVRCGVCVYVFVTFVFTMIYVVRGICIYVCVYIYDWTVYIDREK